MSIYTKLLNFQKEVGAIEKDKVNPFFKSNYADINKFLEVVKPLLSKEGLLLLQPLTNVEGKPAIKTIIIDSETSEKIEDTVIIPEHSDAQKMGAIITYFRRYSLQSILSLLAEDNDANEVAKSFGGTVVQDKNDLPFTNTSTDTCAKCGAPMLISKTSGKPYCSKLCWKNQ